MFSSKKIINFKNFQKKYQGYYLIYSSETITKLKLEQILYELFKDSDNETEFPNIQYIEKSNKIIRYEELHSNNTYFVHITKDSKNYLNYDTNEVKEIIKSNIITILKEEEYEKSMDLTNILALKERINALEGLCEKNDNKLNKKHQEIMAFMMDYRAKIEKQTDFYGEEGRKLEEIENELRLIADQYNKARISIEKNLFFFNK